MAKQWAESPQVRTAIRLSGWPNCSVVEFLHSLAEVLNEIDNLAEKGIRFPDLVASCSEVWCAEAMEDDGETKQDRTPNSSEARQAIRKMWLHGFEPAEIARLTSIAPAKVSAYLDWARMGESSRIVIRLHLDGMIVSRIAADTGMSRERVAAILDDAGYLPNLTREHKVDDGLRAQIMSLRGSGLSLVAVANELDISLDRVKNVVYKRRRAS